MSFWAKFTSDILNFDLISQLNQYNKDNNVNTVPFGLFSCYNYL